MNVMKKIMYLYENCKMPIRLTYFAFFLIAFGFLVSNENVNIFYTFSNSFVLMLASGCLMLGKTIIVNLPLIFMVYLVCKKANSGIPIVLAFLGYFSFLIATCLFAPQNLSTYAYNTSSGINTLISTTGITKYPLETGLLGSFIVAYITRFSYIRSRHRSSHSILGFLHKDGAAMIYNTVLCTLAGIIASYIFPYLYTCLTNAITYISKDLADPTRLFIYGVLDRFLSILGLGSYIRAPFWNSALGGSYQTLSGQSIVGDVNIWSYVKDGTSSYLGCGRFITPYYIINMFMIPAVYLGILFSMSDKQERRHFILLFVGVILLSIICGNPLPTELLLLFTSPLLLVIYIILVGCVFAYLSMNGIYLGSSISASDTITAMPGSFPDFIINIRSIVHYDTLIQILIVGIVVAIITYIIVHIYYHFIAYNLVSPYKNQEDVDNIVNALGGYSNIESVGSGLFRVNFALADQESIDFEGLSNLHLGKSSENKNGVSIELGSSSYIISKMIRKKLNQVNS